MAKKKIAVLNCGPVNPALAPKHGQYDDIFRAYLSDEELAFTGYDAHLSKFPNLDDYDGFILSGSAHSAYEELAFIAQLENFIRRVYNLGKPMAGICFGHQIMAQALGGRVEKFAGGWGLGPLRYQLSLPGRQEEICLHAVHQDQVVEKPATAKVIASSTFCENAGLLYEGGKAVSFQPHPEFSIEWMRDLIAARHGEYFPQKEANDALAELGKPTASREVGDYLRAFLKA